MHIVETWKKQVTFLFSKDLRLIGILALKRYIHLLLSTLGCCLTGILFLSLAIFFCYNLQTLSYVFSMIILFIIILIVIFLRPSAYQKNYTNLFFMVFQQSINIVILSLLSAFLSHIFFIPFSLLAATLCLLSLDGHYRIRNSYTLVKKSILFFLYNLPIMTTMSLTFFCILQFLSYLFMRTSIISVFIGSFMLSLVILFCCMVLVLLYTISVYENDSLYFG